MPNPDFRKINHFFKFHFFRFQKIIIKIFSTNILQILAFEFSEVNFKKFLLIYFQSLKISFTWQNLEKNIFMTCRKIQIQRVFFFLENSENLASKGFLNPMPSFELWIN